MLYMYCTQIIFKNGIVAEAIYPKSGNSTNYKFYWSNEKKHSFLNGKFDIDMPITFSPNTLSSYVTSAALSRGIRISHSLHEFVTPKNHQGFTKERTTGIYSANDSRHNTEAYISGSFTDTKKFLIFSEKHSVDAKYKTYQRNAIAFVDNESFSLDISFKQDTSFSDLSGSSFREIKTSKQQTWFGKLDLVTFKKNGWWTRRADFNADIQQLILFENNKKNCRLLF